MTHKFEPADEKYWAEQRLKQQATAQRIYQERAEKTNFKDLFTVTDNSNTTTK